MTHHITLPLEAEGVQLRTNDVSPYGALDASTETQIDDLCWLAILKDPPFHGRHYSHVSHRGHVSFVRLEEQGLVKLTAQGDLWLVEVL